MSRCVLVLVLFLLLFFSPRFVYAETCDVTPSVLPIKELPADVVSSNNLRRHPGKPDLASGFPILLRGRILDMHCVPVVGARITVWQADANGVYVSESTEDNPVDPHFLGAGVSYTDNAGWYSFVSVLPGVRSGGVPMIHFKVEHPKFSNVESELLLDALAVDDEALVLDYVDFTPELIGQLTAVSRTALLQGMAEGERIGLYSFDIVLQGDQPFRSF